MFLRVVFRSSFDSRDVRGEAVDKSCSYPSPFVPARKEKRIFERTDGFDRMETDVNNQPRGDSFCQPRGLNRMIKIANLYNLEFPNYGNFE